MSVSGQIISAPSDSDTSISYVRLGTVSTVNFQRFSCKPMAHLNDEEIPESFKEACADFNNSKFIDLSDAINTPFPS